MNLLRDYQKKAIEDLRVHFKNGKKRAKPKTNNNIVNGPEPEPENGCYGEKVPNSEAKYGQKCAQQYDPPLPTTLVKEEPDLYGQTCNMKNEYEEGQGMNKKERKEVRYDPPLPTSLLEVKSTKGKHSTEKPVSLMKWVLKYYSKVDDVILDPTMGSGSMGVACKNMNRRFIGIEMDKEIFSVATNRILGKV